MNDNLPDTSANRHLGIRIAVGLAGLVLLALFVMLGLVASKQSATTRALEANESVQEAGKPSTETAGDGK